MKHSIIMAVILLTVLSVTLLMGDTSAGQYKATIFDAIHNRDVATINAMINADPTVLNSRDWWDDTPLNYALRWRSPEMAQAILDHNPQVDVHDSNGLLPVHILVQMHNVKMLDQLVALGADIHSTDTSEHGDALYWAAAGGNNDMMTYLIGKGLDINQGEPDGKKPLNKAAQGGHYYAFLLLIDNGVTFPNTDNGKGLLFQDAVTGANLDIIRYLVNMGYSPRQITSGNEKIIFSTLWLKSPDTVLNYLIDQGVDINKSNKEGSTLLLQTIEVHKYNMTKLLIERGANLNQADNDGMTPFFFAASEFPSVLQYMLDKGVDINRKDNYGDTALLVSVTNDSLLSLQTLLRYKADLNLQNKNGQTALMLACQIQNAEKANLLIKAGSDLETKDVNGRNALHIAVLNGNQELVAALIDGGINLNKKDKAGCTALDYALKYGHKDIAAILQSKHAMTVYKDASRAMEPIDFTQDKTVTGVWYLGASGMAVRSGQNLFIFDYLKPQLPNINPSLPISPRERQAPANPSLYNGWINPEEIKGLNVYVFVTNKYMDPLDRDRRILNLKDIIPNVKYIFGFDTQPGYQNYMYPRLPLYRPIQGSDTDSNGVSIASIKYLNKPQRFMFESPSPVGYCVKVDGITIWYHNSCFNKNDTLSVDYKTVIKTLSADKPVIDLAFLPVELPGLNKKAILKHNTDYFVSMIKPKAIVLVQNIYPRIDDWPTASPEIDSSIWATAPQSIGYKNQTKLLQNPGDHLILKHRKN